MSIEGIYAQKADSAYSSSLYYKGNRAPLIQSKYIKLPVGSVTPQGWLNEYLYRERDGLTGQLGNISAWLQKKDNAWLSSSGKGKWGWEEVPYWLKGYANIGYILNDPQMIAEAKIWIEGALRSQRADGNFGPISYDGSNQDFWANMIMLYCLQSYYEFTYDPRVIDLMNRYFKYQLTVPDDKFINGYWQGLRGGDNLYSVLWLYNQTGEKWLLDLAEKLHRCTTSWILRDNKKKAGNHPQENTPDWYNLLPDWHNVNVAQGFREPATYFQLSKNKNDLQASYDVFNIIRKYFGQVPGGMFGADEVARPGYADPHQGIETCGIVEEMNSDENMLRITGDLFWADHTEEVAFNTYPAATMPDFKSLHYLTAPNMVLCDDKDHSPGVMNSGPFLMMNPFSSRCCQHNHSQGWPYFTENLWLATPDNGAFAALYSACKSKIKVGNGTEVTFNEQTKYPFDEQIAIILSMAKPVNFPLYLRIPGWCSNATVLINGKPVHVRAEAGKALCINRTWKSSDRVVLNLPMKITVKRWENNHNSASVSYGPLTFSLKIKEKYIQKSSDRTAIGDSKWQDGVDANKWPSWEIHPDSNWNYGLVLD
ncbi:MAG: glycoside hydrolase family 127 protein, partial [Bacteroidota bacterium]|nr:glycoside hydrolase family 127 protein [Bacteroidota bacterium]